MPTRLHDLSHQSLLLRAQGGDRDAWDALIALYRPLIVGWQRRLGVPAADLEDLSQNVLLAVVKNLPSFQNSGRRRAFGAWVRTIVTQQTCDYWRAHKQRRLFCGGSEAAAALHKLEDPASDFNRQWEEEHAQYVLRRLLEVVEQEFEPATRQAFRRLALDGASGATVARELGCSVAAIYVAKSRVLRRLRQEAAGLLD